MSKLHVIGVHGSVRSNVNVVESLTLSAFGLRYGVERAKEETLGAVESRMTLTGEEDVPFPAKSRAITIAE